MRSRSTIRKGLFLDSDLPGAPVQRPGRSWRIEVSEARLPVVKFRTGHPFFSLVLSILLASSTFAETPASGLDFYSLQSVFQVPDTNLSTERAREIQAMWSYPENLRERFDDFVALETDHSNAYLRRARSMFDRTRKIDLKFLQSQKEVYRLLKDNDDPRPFAAREARDSIRNDFSHKKIRHHETMSAEYSELLRLLESGRAGALSSNEVDQLYRETLRLSIIHYIKGRRYQDGMLHLRRYFQLEPEAAVQWPFHYYVAVCLHHIHRGSIQEREPLPRQWQLRGLRDRYTLNYLELRYGRDSYQYRETFARLRREAGPYHFLKGASDGL